MDAKLILTKNVNEFKNTFDKESADGGLHLYLGKVMLSVELGLITLKEMDEYIDRLFNEHFHVKNG
ncbi:MAG: hypothetical protein IJJ10_06535 [Bacillus sp. (in: Bacteria)]|nr:hypothetical protein [Bacillus sp. (in: firmicutes)]